ncbi:unnamed protein product [Adineta steineri]|nr:unnamed protein product [Adineta steineri]
MNENKRHQCSTTDGNKMKKFRCTSYEKHSVTHFEDLANELILEVFDNLDTYQIYQSFFHLNIRFQNLCTHANLSIQVGISSVSKTTFQRYYNDFIAPNKHRIQTLHLSNPFIIDFFVSLSEDITRCSQLQTLTLCNIEYGCRETVLAAAAYLPNLSSLSICVSSQSDKITIYKLIFQLPILKYCKMTFQDQGRDSLKLLPIPINSSSIIERLVISDNYDFCDIDTILSYVPRIRYLSVRSQNLLVMRDILGCLVIFNDLTHMSIITNCLSPISTEEFVKKHSHRINVLHVSSGWNSTCTQTWENSILSYIPYLDASELNHSASLFYNRMMEIHESTYNYPISRVLSAYQRFFTHEPMSKEYLHEIFCSIQPHRDKVFKFVPDFNMTTCQCRKEPDCNSIKHIIINSTAALPNCSKYFPKITELTLHDKAIIQRKPYLMDDLRRILPLVQLTKLTMNNIFYELDIFINILQLTPNLHTVTWISIKNTPKDLLSLQESKAYQLVSKQNQLCPRVQYISLGPSDRSLDATVHYLLSKINDATLHLFLLRIRGASPHWIKCWKDKIESHEVLYDYSTKVIGSSFYLWWGD